MGLSASAYNLCRYTMQKNNIGCELTRLALQKTSLARDLKKLSREYQESMNQKTLKWTTNAGVDYYDMDYSTLMRPSNFNNSQLYMISDLDGKIVVDSKYRQYAELISPNGEPHGDYNSNRSNILSQLLGISPDDIETADIAYNAMLDNKADLENLRKPEIERYRFYKTNVESILGEKLTGYDANAKFEGQESEGALRTFIDNMKTLSPYFGDLSEKFETKCENIYEKIEKPYLSEEAGRIAEAEEDDDDDYEPNWHTQEDVALSILGGFSYWYDIDDESYNEYNNDMQDWENEKAAIQARIDAAVAVYSSIYVSNTKSQADFYDELFSSIADNGWSYYERINEPEYLNNMFQNGFFNITTVDRTCYTDGYGSYSYSNDYFTQPALNCQNIIQVNDSARNNQKYVEYQAEKELINEKESRIDTRMKNLETEAAAIKQMIESVTNIIKNNTEQSFNIFNA